MTLEKQRPSAANRGGADDDGRVGNSLRRVARRTMEPQPAWAECKWLPRCHGATQIRATWTALDLWCPPLWQALNLPKLGYRYPCDGCPLTNQQETAA